MGCCCLDTNSPRQHAGQPTHLHKLLLACGVNKHRPKLRSVPSALAALLPSTLGSGVWPVGEVGVAGLHALAVAGKRSKQALAMIDRVRKQAAADEQSGGNRSLAQSWCDPRCGARDCGMLGLCAAAQSAPYVQLIRMSAVTVLMVGATATESRMPESAPVASTALLPSPRIP